MARLLNWLPVVAVFVIAAALITFIAIIALPAFLPLKPLISARHTVLQPPVFAALIALFGASFLGPLFSSLYAERQLQVQARQQRLSKQISLASSLTESLDRLLATHNLEFEMRARMVALEQHEAQPTVLVQTQYTQITAAWIRSVEGLTEARAAYAAAASEANHYFGHAVQNATTAFRIQYNDRGDSFRADGEDPLFTVAGQVLGAVAEEVNRQS